MLRLVTLVAVVGALAACAKDDSAYRGRGLDVATLPVNDLVGVYRAALQGSFSMDDPSLSILIDTLMLPRSAGLEGGAPMSAELRAALQASGIAKGTCSIPVRATREPLRCDAARPGYVARFSEPFTLGKDSVQVSMVVQQYATLAGPTEVRLRFERAYHIARRGASWRATREARFPAP